jgi:hypothetical protein
LDVTATLPDRGKAVGLGQKFNQKSVLDLSNFETIETGGTGEAEASMPSVKERMDTIILSSAKFKRSTAQLDGPAREQEAFKTWHRDFKFKMENILGAYKSDLLCLYECSVMHESDGLSGYDGWCLGRSI